jgi:hypothetical protein
MKWLLRRVARLYPSAWRDRYGEEFDLLVQQMTPRPRYIVDILFGAVAMHLSRATRLSFVAGLSIAGAITGTLVSLNGSPVYLSSSRVQVSVPDERVVGDERGRTIRSAIEVTLDTAALDRRTVAVRVAEESAVAPTLLEVTALGDSPEGALQATQKALKAMISGAVQGAALRPSDYAVQFKVVTPAGDGVMTDRRILRNSVVGAAAGSMAGGALAVLGYRRRRTTNA